jgi:hypothetical protein
MPMTEHIEPALPPEDWAMHAESAADENVALQEYLSWHTVRPVQSIALANAALPDTDPRKITREMVEAMRYAAYMLMEVSREAADDEEFAKLHTNADRLFAGADALASYLPPE